MRVRRSNTKEGNKNGDTQLSIPVLVGWFVLEALDFARFLTFLPLSNHELNALPFFEGAVTITRDPGVVNENVLFRAVNCDEAVPFGIVKPLDNTG
jgi:hypothetical protein